MKIEAAGFVITPRLPGGIMGLDRGVTGLSASLVRAEDARISFFQFGGNLSRSIANGLEVDND